MITTSVLNDYWANRFAHAIEKAKAAPSDRSRLAYLELADHYYSMHELFERREHGRAESGAVTFMQAA